MIHLELCVAAYRRSHMKADLDHHPVLWAGYWSDQFLGCIYATGFSEEMVFWLTSPFSQTADISTVFVVVDCLNSVKVARLEATESGHWTTFWTLPYTIDDEGVIRFGMGRKEPGLAEVSKVFAFLSAARLSEEPEWSYEQAFATALELARANG